MISSVCSQWTIPMSPSLQWLEQSPGSTISVWVLTEEGLRVCPGTNDFKWVGPCSLLCLECLIDLETSLSTIRGIWSCPFSLKPSALQPLGHPSPGPDLFGSFLHWGVQELVAFILLWGKVFSSPLLIQVSLGKWNGLWMWNIPSDCSAVWLAGEWISGLCRPLAYYRVNPFSL